MTKSAFTTHQPVSGMVQIIEPLGCRSLRWHALIDGDDFSLVDTGLPGSVCRWLDSGQAPTGKLRQVFFTHADADHIGDGHALQDRYPATEFLAHGADRTWIEDHDRLAQERYDHGRAVYGFSYHVEVLQSLRDACGPDFSITSEVREGDFTEAGGRQWEILHVPGHSPGHISLWNSANGILIAGDCVLGEGPPDEGGTPSMPPTHQFIDDYLATIQRLKTLPIQLALTAHWPMMNGAEFQQFLHTSESVVHRDLETVKSAQGLGITEFEPLLRLLNESHGSWGENEYAHYSYALSGYLEYLKRE